jgi:alanine racemase
MRATRAYIHLDNVRSNIRLLQRHIGGSVSLCAAVKANAYGHGDYYIAKTALEEGVHTLAVACVDEALSLRENGIHAPLLLLSVPLPEEIPAIVRHNIHPLTVDSHTLSLFSRESRKQNKVTVTHLKVDTGMGRIGCTPEQAPGLAALISEDPNLELGGVCTHFPIADVQDQTFTRKQIAVFSNVIERIRSSGIQPGVLHAANSGAAIHCPESYFDMVRLGIALYGYYPSHDQERVLPLKPVMGLETKIVFLKRVRAGTPISYGLTYTTKRETVIATLPIGYGDGLSRLLSSKADVMINGYRYPIVGRICMDQTMVDLGPHPQASLYDRVVLFGPEPGSPTAEELADLSDTIPYEITTSISARVPRVYV